MSAPNELRVFISSTFRDLQEEREHLVKKIFPEIRALCRERGITFTEVDLRWGLTEEEAVLGQVIRTCLEEIDKCCPYFIGITGERYGYVPELHEYYKDPELLQRWPWIEEAAMDGASIIDLEFRHAVLNTPPLARGGAGGGVRFFFQRKRRSLDGSDVAGDEAKRLEELKQRVRIAGLSVQEFRDPGSLGEMVYDELIEIIQRDFAAAKPPTPLEEERSKHEAFAASRRRAYIPNPEYLKRLNEWFVGSGDLPEQGSREVDPTPPLILYAESGSGKSSLVSFWCEQLRRRRPELPTIEHYVGIGAGDTDHLGIIRHVMQEIKERFDRSEEIPTKSEELERDFANWLGFNISHSSPAPLPTGDGWQAERAGLRSPLLVVIDGINQLSGRALELGWIPPTIPPGVKLIISSTVEQTLVDLRRRGWEELGMQPLKEPEREAVVVRFLAEYRKALSAEQVKRIAEDVKCSHPLFLRTLLEELRLHGTYEQLERTLLKLLSSTGTEDLFQRVLERLEEDYNLRVVRDVMALLWCSRNGLSELDLSEMTGTSRLKLSTLLLGLDYHLVRRDGVLTFFHDYLRRAVEKRHLTQASSREDRYRLLADHFERTDVTLRSTLELLHALEKLGDRERLTGVLSDMERFMELWESEQYEMLRLWSTSAPSSVAAAYQAGLQRWQATVDQQAYSVALGYVASLLESVGAWPEAQSLHSERLLLAIQRRDREQEAAARTQLGWLLNLQGKPESSFEELERARDLYGELGDHRGLSLAIGIMGYVHNDRGAFDKALEYFQQKKAICGEIGDRYGVSQATLSIGLVHSDRGENELALECFRQAETYLRDVGDRMGLAGILHNIARVYDLQGKYDEAMQGYEQALDINRSVGNRNWIAANLNSMGIVSHNRGDLERALDFYRQNEALSRELGHRRGVAGVLHNIGMVYDAQGKPDEAFEKYKEALEINRSIGNRHWIPNNLGSMGHVHLNRGEHAEALECFTQQEAISREIGDPHGVVNAIGSLGLVSLASGKYAEALERLQQQEALSREIGDVRQVVHAIGNMGMAYSDRGDYDEALECFRQAEEMGRELGDRINMAGSIGNMGMVYFNRGEYREALRYYQKAAEEHRAIGFSYGLSSWLLGTAQVLTELVQVEDEMPEYLTPHVPGATVETWRAMSLRAARQLVEKSLAISEELSRHDMRFDGRVMLARISAAEGDIAASIDALDGMLTEATDDEQRGELHFRLWELGWTEQEEHRIEALRLYELLFAKAPKHKYRKRIDQLSAGTNTTEAGDAPE